MAEATVKILLGKIMNLLESELSLLGGVRSDFNEIKLELDFMKSFLKDAEKRSNRDTNNREGIQTWMEHVRDAAYDVEDIIDEFTYCFGNQQQSKNEGFMAFFHQRNRLPNTLWDKHTMANKLKEIKAQLKSISDKSKEYGFDRIIVEQEYPTSSTTTNSLMQNRGESPLFLEDDDIVGIEKERELLLGWLLEDEQRRTVISVYGIGGAGKTTLAANIYKSNTVMTHFHCCAWITVSQTYVIEDLFRKMIEEFFQSKTKFPVPEQLSTMRYAHLVETLLHFLKTKRYVVVIDDVWNTNLWEEIQSALPRNECGSRIVLTTRKENVARFPFGVGSCSHVHHIQPLQEKEAWILFCRRAFSSHPNSPPAELEAVARLIVKKCDGLPLAILAMGGLMSLTESTYLEWKMVYDSLNWELSNNPMLETVKSVLLLSYNELPYYLKPCFLYFCAFPEDHIISQERLIHLWVAEGFVEERRGKTVEEVAKTYMEELISRSMLQVIWRFNNRVPQEFKVHDLMRELALSMSEKENFCMVHDKSNDESEVMRNDCRAPRRLSIHKQSDLNAFSQVNPSKLRSFFIFPPGYTDCLPFRLLRVLDLQDVHITRLSNGIVNLFNLQYLNMRGTWITKLPKSIGRLQNLRTLNIRETRVQALPSSIVKLKNLRTLLMSHRVISTVGDHGLVYDKIDSGIQVPRDIWKLKNLHELGRFESKGDRIKLVGNNMTQLRNLGITKVREVETSGLCSTIQKLNRLRYLLVMMINEDEILKLDAISSPPPLLEFVMLIGKLEKVPVWFGSLRNIVSLCLFWSKLSGDEDPLVHIQALPFLEALKLLNAYDGQQLCFRHGSFLRLKCLTLFNLPHLNTVVIETEAMPKLKELLLRGCVNLKMVPDGIQRLTNLQLLRLSNMSEELVKRVRGEGSVEDRLKVQHIPRIEHYYKSTTLNQWCYESLSS